MRIRLHAGWPAFEPITHRSLRQWFSLFPSVHTITSDPRGINVDTAVIQMPLPSVGLAKSALRTFFSPALHPSPLPTPREAQDQSFDRLSVPRPDTNHRGAEQWDLPDNPKSHPGKLVVMIRAMFPLCMTGEVTADKDNNLCWKLWKRESLYKKEEEDEGKKKKRSLSRTLFTNKFNDKQKQGLSPCTAKTAPPPPRVSSDTVSCSITVSICPLSCTWFCLIVKVHQHTYFGCQANSGTENIRQWLHEDLNLHCELGLERNNPDFFSFFFLFFYTRHFWMIWWCVIQLNMAGKKKEQSSSIDMIEAVMFDFEPSL